MLVYLIGVVFSGVGFYMLYDTYYFRKHAKSYIGKIISHKKLLAERYASGQERYSYYPIVEYRDENKNSHEFISDMNMSKSRGDVGQNVEVLVLNANHSTARIKQQGRLVLAYAFGIVGPIMLIIALMVINESFITYFLLAIALIAGFFYLTQILVTSSRRRKSRFTHPLMKDDDSSQTSYSDSVDSNPTPYQTTSQTSSYVRSFFAVLFFLLALAVFWFGLNQANNVNKANTEGIKVKGTVVEDTVHREGGMDVHTIIVNYKPLGADVQRTILHKTIAPKLKIGDSCEVVYQPNDHTSVRLYREERVINNYRNFILVIGGILLIITFLVMPKKVFWNKS